MKALLLRAMAATMLVLSLAVAALFPARADAHAAPVPFHGTVYQVDTVFNFIDVDTAGGRKRIYADDASVVHVRSKRAQLIDIAMGEQVRGTYRVDAKGSKIVVAIDDLTAR